LTERTLSRAPVRLGAPLAVAAGAGLACVAVWIGDPTTPGGPLPVCPTKLLLGIDCPGCGGLRMVYSLLHGDLAAAVAFNALGLVALGLLLWAYTAWTYGRVVGRRMWSWQRHRWAPWVTLVLVSAWFVLRNLPFEPFTALRV
jgi:type IV secretory pathway TrbD component